MDPPTNLEIREVKADSITLTWRNPSNQQCQFRVVQYKIKLETDWTYDPVKMNQETVTLSELEPDTEYEIRVTAMDKQGCTVSSDVVTTVTAKTPINPPTNVVVKEVKEDSIILAWTNPSDQECQFEIEIRVTPVGKEGCSVSSGVVTAVNKTISPPTNLEVDDTRADSIMLTLRNPSDDVTAITRTIDPQTNVEVMDVKSDSITLTWTNPSDKECHPQAVQYRMKQETEWTSQSVQNDQNTITLSGLKLDTEYEIRVTAVGKQGFSVRSSIVTVMTAKNTMNPPTNVMVKEVKADSITLTWRNPSDQERQFLIIEHKLKQNTEWSSQIVKQNEEEVTLSELMPGRQYEIRVTAVGKVCSVSSDVITTTTTKAIISPPTDVIVTHRKANSITFTWSNPKLCKYLKQYIIEYRMETSSVWKKEETGTIANTFTLKNLKQNTPYSIRILTESPCGMSEPSDEIKHKTRKEAPDSKEFIQKSYTDSPPLYLLNLKSEERTEDRGTLLHKKQFGEPSKKCFSNRTIMLVGATGSGKTTLINGMINYILGVDWEDNWRFKLIDEVTNKSQAHSQTSEVTAYQINHTEEFQVPYSLTIIDTPGFGDTKGVKQDEVIKERIRQFFTSKGGIATIDAVCFVVQSALSRLTGTQKYIFDAILSVFGKNIANNIVTLVTFSDGKSPPVLEAIKEAEIPCATHADGSPVYFKFNNSVLFANNTGGGSEYDDFDYMFWRMGKASMDTFFTHLNTMEAQSLTLTQEVLQERKQLGATVEGVQPLIRKGLTTMEEIRTTQAMLDNHKTQIQENKDFEYEVMVDKSDKIDIPSGTFITNCHGCNYTCHYPCQIRNDADKSGCAAMANENCTVCPGKCVWSVHHNMTYRWEIKSVKEKRTYQDLKRKYEKAMGEKMDQEQMVVKLEEEYHQVQGKVIEMMETVTASLKRLKEIALRPDPLATPDYIDLLILSEEQEAKPGFKQRIKQLQEVKEGAILIQKVAANATLNVEEQSKFDMIKSKAKAAYNDFLGYFTK